MAAMSWHSSNNFRQHGFTPKFTHEIGNDTCHTDLAGIQKMCTIQTNNEDGKTPKMATDSELKIVWWLCLNWPEHVLLVKWYAGRILTSHHIDVRGLAHNCHVIKRAPALHWLPITMSLHLLH